MDLVVELAPLRMVDRDERRHRHGPDVRSVSRAPERGDRDRWSDISCGIPFVNQE
jgi:hypothetical protein